MEHSLVFDVKCGVGTCMMTCVLVDSFDVEILRNYRS